MAAWNLDGHVFRNNLERRARETSVNCLLRDIYIHTIDFYCMILLAVRIVVLCQYFYSLREEYLLDREVVL